MKTRIILYTAIAVVLFGCSENKSETSDYNTVELGKEVNAADTTAIAKIIKTADMRFRVKDVQQAKAQLSKSVKEWGGTVTEAATTSYIASSERMKYSADSIKEITSYNTQGVLVAKVPSELLDDFTNSVAQLSLFIDNQSLKMDDQSITYLQNRLKTRNRTNAIDKINKVATKNGKNITTGLDLSDDVVDKRIDNMRIDERVKFSTITLNFYQSNTVKTFLVANDSTSDYRPAFFKRLGLNLASGWGIFTEFLLAMANIWVFLLLIIAGFFTYRHFTRR